MTKSIAFRVQTLLLLVLLAGVLSACGADATPIPASEPAKPDAATPTPVSDVSSTSSGSGLGTGTASDFTRKVWQWQKTEMNDGTTTIATNPDKYSISFIAKTMAVKADCNTGGAQYTLDGNTLTFGPLALTEMVCPPGSQEAVFLKGLQEVGSYLIQGDKLILELKMDSGSMTFVSRVSSSGDK